MYTVEVNQISKRFGATQAVEEVSFKVRPGEIFGLLGPNGAGKTTTIRILLDIFKPDGGTVAVLGGAMTEENKNRVGYMPEDRGLYQDVPLERGLTYLGTLKGLRAAEIKTRLADWLETFDLTEHKSKKVKELSKGMQQKAQIIATLIHEPQLIVIDEPFTALDPVNTQLIKSILDEQRRQGKTVIMCTHQMHQVEEMSDRILLIDKGKDVLYGKLSDIRAQFSGHAVLVRSQNAIPEIPGVIDRSAQNGAVLLTLDEGTSPQEALQALIANHVQVEQFEIAVPSLDEIFIKVVNQGQSQ